MKKGPELYRGKTKAIFATDDENLVILQNFDSLTKFDDPSLTAQMKDKAIHATKTTCNVFRLLQEAGIPVAFKQQISDTEFLAEKCQMIPVEVVSRRYAVGSYLNRFPNLKAPEGENPFRFHSLEYELFLKTTGKVIKSFDGYVLGETTVEDPLIGNSRRLEMQWELRHPKIPYWEPTSLLNISIEPRRIFGPQANTFFYQTQEYTKKTFLLLEGAFAQLGFRLIDFKIEFGVTNDGRLVIADVIDNDSWRLRTASWVEVSKECFRQNAGMEEISSKYAMVSKLTDSFKLPLQAIIVWRGSEKDEPIKELSKPYDASLCVSDIVRSGHKSTQSCLDTLKNTLRGFPEGGVIIALVGMSNGLGPILASRTSWPVIAVPLTAIDNPNDVWSSLNVPSNVPLMTVMSKKNALLAALNILALKNPYAYMLRQYEIEKLDN